MNRFTEIKLNTFFIKNATSLQHGTIPSSTTASSVLSNNVSSTTCSTSVSSNDVSCITDILSNKSGPHLSIHGRWETNSHTTCTTETPSKQKTVQTETPSIQTTVQT